MAEPQSYKNHAILIPGYHYVAFSILTLNLGWQIKLLADALTFTAIVNVLMAVAIILLFFYARVFALTVQDRVIRLEMRLRMREVLPASMHARIGEFSRAQLVALRFAGDAELPALAEQVLRDKVQDKKAIKQMITDWQADHLRA